MARKKRRCTSNEPLLRQIFDEAERLGVKMTTLAKLSGISYGRVLLFRNPDIKYQRGFNPRLDEVRSLALALDFEFPDRLSKSH
jgi:hypothetical protein